MNLQVSNDAVVDADAVVTAYGLTAILRERHAENAAVTAIAADSELHFVSVMSSVSAGFLWRRQ